MEHQDPIQVLPGLHHHALHVLADDVLRRPQEGVRPLFRHPKT